MHSRCVTQFCVALTIAGALAGQMATAESRLTLLIPPSVPSAAPDRNPSSEFSELTVVPFHNAQAVHTYSNKAKKFVFIYCTEPGKIKTIAITLSYGDRPPDKRLASELPSHVSAAILSVQELDGRVLPFFTSGRSARTYAIGSEHKSDIVLQFSDTEFEKLKNARSFEAEEDDLDISKLMNFDIHGSRERFDNAFKSCVSRL